MGTRDWLAPNGTHFVSGTALAAGNSPENVDLELPVASAKPLKVSAIGQPPSLGGDGLIAGTRAERLVDSQVHIHAESSDAAIAHQEMRDRFVS